MTACQSSNSAKSAPLPIAHETAHQQLIVKFNPATFRCDSTDIARLGAQVDLQLELVRPLSGGACVIRQLRGGSNDFVRGRTLLQQHPAIEWVEPDAEMKTM